MTKETRALRPFEAELLPMLAHAARESVTIHKPARARGVELRWQRGVVVAAVGVTLALAVPLLTTDPLRGALAVQQRGDTIFVSVKDADANPEAMTNDLRSAGLPATVESVPVSPSLEGTWLDVVNDNISEGHNDPRISDVMQQISSRPEVLELPADFSTPFTLRVGRPARAGETWMVATNRDVSSAFGCLGLQGLTAVEAAEKLDAGDYDVRWYRHVSQTQTEELGDAPAGGVVIDAAYAGPSMVTVYVADPDAAAGREPTRERTGRADC